MTETRRTIDELLDEAVVAAGTRGNRDVVRDLFASAASLAGENVRRLDLKIARAALTEMTAAFRIFAPYHNVPKVTIFGSARTSPTDALYVLARELAKRMAEAGWMTVTGAGEGIMAAGSEGAGPGMALGVNIRLPFEQDANEYLVGKAPVVEMRYFFTRKLMLMKESSGFAALPGGFGTLDETFELITLLQTGKAEPAPIVLLDAPGDDYWWGWTEFVKDHVIGKAYAGPTDAALWRVVDSVDAAADELLGFYRNYHSRRFVGKSMVLRMRHGVSDAELEALNRNFADAVGADGIWRTEAMPAERSGKDHVDLPRLACVFDSRQQGRLRQLIDALNDCHG
jgi:uncharacterized protein (TIGR00730 family)